MINDPPFYSLYPHALNLNYPNPLIIHRSASHVIKQWLQQEGGGMIQKEVMKEIVKALAEALVAAPQVS